MNQIQKAIDDPVLSEGDALAQAKKSKSEPDYKSVFFTVGGGIFILFLLLPAFGVALHDWVFPAIGQFFTYMGTFKIVSLAMTPTAYIVTWFFVALLFLVAIACASEARWNVVAFTSVALGTCLVLGCWIWGPALSDMQSLVSLHTFFGSQVLVAVMLDFFSRIAGGIIILSIVLWTLD